MTKMGKGFGRVQKQRSKQARVSILPTRPGLVQARQLIDCGELEQAANILQPLVESSQQSDAQAHLGAISLMAECHLLAKDYQAAASLIENSYGGELDDIELLVKLASSYRNLGKPNQAIIHLQKAIDILPGRNELYYNYANALRDAGRSEEALQSYQRSIDLGCSAPSLYFNFLSLLFENRRYTPAINIVQRARELYPDNPDLAYAQLALLRALDRCDEALEVIKDLKLDQYDAHYYYNYSVCLDGTGATEKAIEYAEKSLGLDPCHIDAYRHLGNIYQTSGNIAMATATYRIALNRYPDDAELHRRLSTCIKYTPSEPHLHELRRLISITESLTEDQEKRYCFALAKAEEEVGNYEAAFGYLQRGNLLMHEEVSRFFDLKTWMMHAVKYLEIDRALLRRSIAIGDQSKGKGMIFIVGMPRSGSTLTENLLSMSPLSVDLGESMVMPRIVQELIEVQDSLEDINQNILEQFGSRYLELIPVDSSGSALITDKNLYNWRYAGLIAHCLPGAKIIHIYRNPMDNLLSLYKAHFPIGNEYAFDLESIFKVYQLQHQALAYYKQRHRSVIVNSSYDELVTSPESYIPTLIDALGLEWSERYLSPEKSSRRVRTASNIQVREPIHSRSVGGWKRYESQLKPLALAFQREGFIVD